MFAHQRHTGRMAGGQQSTGWVYLPSPVPSPLFLSLLPSSPLSSIPCPSPASFHLLRPSVTTINATRQPPVKLPMGSATPAFRLSKASPKCYPPSGTDMSRWSKPHGQVATKSADTTPVPCPDMRCPGSFIRYLCHLAWVHPTTAVRPRGSAQSSSRGRGVFSLQLRRRIGMTLIPRRGVRVPVLPRLYDHYPLRHLECQVRCRMVPGRTVSRQWPILRR